MRLSGSITALVTPFKGRSVDEEALRRLVRFQVKNGTSALVPCGSTGEAATLHLNEYRRAVEVVDDEADGRVPVIAGVASNDTEKAVVLAKSARDAGADALLVLVPYYNKPTQEGMFRHFGAVAKAVPLPTVAYNIPGRTGVNMAPATLARIAAAYPNIFAVKEASGSIEQVSETILACPKGFTVLSATTSLTVPMMALGAKGSSACSERRPKESAKMVAARSPATQAAPPGTCACCRRCGRSSSRPTPSRSKPPPRCWVSARRPRLPLTPATAATRAALEAAFKKAGLTPLMLKDAAIRRAAAWSLRACYLLGPWTPCPTGRPHRLGRRRAGRLRRLWPGVAYFPRRRPALRRPPRPRARQARQTPPPTTNRPKKRLAPCGAGPFFTVLK